MFYFNQEKTKVTRLPIKKPLSKWQMRKLRGWKRKNKPNKSKKDNSSKEAPSVKDVEIKQEKGFIYKGTLLEKKDNAYPCSYCPSKFTLLNTLEKHLRSAHNLSGKEIYGTVTCETCGKEVSKTQISQHKRTHIQIERPCEICGKILKNELIYYYHMKKFHNPGRPIDKTSEIQLCHICGIAVRLDCMSRHLNKKHANGSSHGEEKIKKCDARYRLDKETGLTKLPAWSKRDKATLVKTSGICQV